MQLSTLTLKNFRSCRTTDVTFAQDLTVLVGENASGKSSIVDALRLATFPASGRSTAWFNPSRDLCRGLDRGEPVEIGTRYGHLTEAENAVYLAELLDSHEDLIYTATFATGVDVPRRSVLSWSVSESMAEDPEPALRRRISHVYLPPLRDAVRDLDGGDQTQLHEVMRILIGKDTGKEQSFTSEANAALKVLAEHDLAVETRNAIQGFFTQTTPPNRAHRIELSQRELELHRIARLLRIQLAEHGVPVGDIAAAGLGYANLLYISMVVLQLVNAKDSDLTLLLVEEPEAHLHPQLQLVLLDFLRDQAAASGTIVDGLHPTGKVQVIVTTHSPVLASTVSINNVVVVARDGDTADWCTRTTALSELGLTDKQTRKIDRYLNTTRASLLFARDVVLVEGVAELLLLPALAQYHLASEDGAEGAEAPPPVKAQQGAEGPKATEGHERTATAGADEAPSKRHLRQFRSATIVSVEGVDFAPYLQLLLGGTHPRVDRVVVVTDRDDTHAGDLRKTTYEGAFPEAVNEKRLIIEVGGTTLEAEMFRQEGNEVVLKAAFLDQRPGSSHHWTKVIDAVEGKDQDVRAETFARAIAASSAKAEVYLDITKGEFAHVVAEAVLVADATGSITVPDYLARTIEAVAHMNPIP